MSLLSVHVERSLLSLRFDFCPTGKEEPRYLTSLCDELNLGEAITSGL
ncbi:MAG TPA: hypothetical protein VMO76_04070 [Candidatus Udaeobacter sp.]|nr:hypothetical protein [Candidatus Udaeobacter sp.]